MTILNSFFTAAAFVFFLFLFERERYRGTVLRRVYILSVELIVLSILIYFTDKLFS